MLDDATAEWAREQLRGPWWFRAATCRDADNDDFFLERGQKAARAKELCSRCPVVDACLEYAIDNGLELRIFGGRTPAERRALDRRRRLARTA